MFACEFNGYDLCYSMCCTYSYNHSIIFKADIEEESVKTVWVQTMPSKCHNCTALSAKLEKTKQRMLFYKSQLSYGNYNLSMLLKECIVVIGIV